MKTICITGPECTGKTTLAEFLSEQYNVPLIAEHARIYLEKLNRHYEQNDLLEIAKAHAFAISDLLVTNITDAPFVVIDTDLTTIKIWSEEKFGNVAEELLSLYNNERFDLYLLCKPDLPWVQDGQRENPHDRNRLFELYKKELEAEGKNFRIVNGKGDVRTGIAIGAIAEFLNVE